MSISSLEFLTQQKKVELTAREQELIEKIIPVLKDAELTYDDAYEVLYKVALVLAYQSRFTHLD